MKLYTEEQLRTAFIAGMEFIAVHPLKYEQDANEYINSITPIELPSEKEVANLNPYGWKDNLSAALSWQRGAEYVIRLIKGDKQ